MSVTRWKHDALGHMTTEPDGEYVAYADYARVLEEYDNERKQYEKGTIYLRQQYDSIVKMMNCAQEHADYAEADLARVRGLVAGLLTAVKYGDIDLTTYTLSKDTFDNITEKADALAVLLDARRKEDAW